MKYSIKKHSFFSYLTQYHERNQFFIATPHSKGLAQRPRAWATGHSECIKKGAATHQRAAASKSLCLTKNPISKIIRFSPEGLPFDRNIITNTNLHKEKKVMSAVSIPTTINKTLLFIYLLLTPFF
jgi:hypothetical protein